jgi:hypothetical protein
LTPLPPPARSSPPSTSPTPSSQRSLTTGRCWHRAGCCTPVSELKPGATWLPSLNPPRAPGSP